jgi:hypothetical protein
MKKQIVCKTVTSFGVENPKPYALIFDDGSIVTFPTLEGVAAQLRTMFQKKESGFLFIKNEAPGDIIWKHDAPFSGETWECERLSKSELHQLALLLKKG